MPLYEYDCAACGSFSASRPIAEFRLEQACPACGQPAPRSLGLVSGIGTGALHPATPTSGPRRLGFDRSHGAGCGCCAPRKRGPA